MNSRLLAVITDDKEVLEDLVALLELFLCWEMKVYTNVDKAWIDYLSREPDLSIIDLDFTGINMEREAGIMIREGRITPLILFISHEAKSSLYATFAVDMNALDYLQKPINLDRIVFALSVAKGPKTEANFISETESLDKPGAETV